VADSCIGARGGKWIIVGAFMKPTFDEPNPVDELRKQARDQALAEFKEIERKSLLAEMLEEERAKLRPPKLKPELEELVSITIDVPPNMFINQANETGLVIDGRVYVHGTTYQVSRSLSNDLNHLMFRANHNEKSMGSPNREMNRRKIIDARAGQVIIDSRVA
jgi:hypothetical protein